MRCSQGPNTLRPHRSLQYFLNGVAIRLVVARHQEELVVDGVGALLQGVFLMGRGFSRNVFFKVQPSQIFVGSFSFLSSLLFFFSLLL